MSENNNKIYLGKKAVSATSKKKLPGFSGVKLAAKDSNGDDTEYSAGGTSGRVLDVEVPWGTDTMATNMLTQISGYQAQPYTASGALLDPAAELGDGVTVDGIYSIIAERTLNLGNSPTSDIGAASDNELESEYNYETKHDKKVTRRILKAQEDAISEAADYTDAEVATGVASANQYTDDSWKYTVTDPDTGTQTTITVTAQGINTKVQEIDGVVGSDSLSTGTYSTLTQVANGIYATVTDTYMGNSALYVLADEIHQRVTDANGNYTVLNLRSDGLYVYDNTQQGQVQTQISGTYIRTGTVTARYLQGSEIEIQDSNSSPVGTINTRASTLYIGNNVVQIVSENGLSLEACKEDPDTHTISGGAMFLWAYNDIILRSESAEEIQMDGSAIPGSNNLYYCGYPGNAWKDVYFNDEYGNAISLQDVYTQLKAGGYVT